MLGQQLGNYDRKLSARACHAEVGPANLKELGVAQMVAHREHSGYLGAQARGMRLDIIEKSCAQIRLSMRMTNHQQVIGRFAVLDEILQVEGLLW